MNTKLFASIIIALALVQMTAARADTLSVTASETPIAGLYDYSYQFSLTGAGPGADTLFLGSDDLSPLSVNILLGNTLVNDWSWLGNDVPQNYLEFFSTDGSKLSSGDTLEVTFTSAFAPTTTQFAVGLDSSTGAATNRVSGVLAPTAAVPEPGVFWVLLFFISALFMARWMRSSCWPLRKAAVAKAGCVVGLCPKPSPSWISAGYCEFAVRGTIESSDAPS